jgi:uncharacterized membrane protein YczE/cytidylate kinase
MTAMISKELVRRYIVFTVGLFLSAFGVSLIARTMLGTSPISSAAFVLSLYTPLTMGTYIFSQNILMIIGQMMMLGKEGVKSNKFDLLMQLPVSFVFGLFVDMSMMALQCFNSDIYWIRIAVLVVAVMIMAKGIALQVLADVTMNSGEYFVRVAANRFKKEFGGVKISFDVTLVLIAIVVSFFLSGKIVGVREGTVIAAVLTGPFVKLVSPMLGSVKRWAFQSVQPIQPAVTVPVEGHTPIVITVARQYGSGGHDLAESIANKLNIKFYDNQLIDMVAEEQGLTRQYISDNEQRMSSSLLLRMVTRDYEAPVDKSLSKDDALFVATNRVIRHLASEGDCVIVGRCADYVLRDMPGCINIYVHASDDYKIKRAIKQYGLSPETAGKEVARINKSRASHYQHYTERRWDDLNNYDLTCDTSTISHDTLVELVAGLYNSRKAAMQA